MRKSADAVVVGGGVQGASIAYNLLRLGMKNVVLCEKNTFANGSTGRCGAGVREQWGREGNCLLAKAAIDIFEQLPEELQPDRDIEFLEKGYLMMAYTEKEWAQFQKNVALQNRLGIKSVIMTPDDVRETFPPVSVEGLYGATFNARDGHANPFQTTRAYLQAFRRLGGEASFFTRVTGVDVSGGQVRRVTTDRGAISTPIVVNAAGPWAAPIAEMVGVELPLFTQRHQILATEPVGWILNPMLMSFSRNYYCQQGPEGSFVMGMGNPAEPLGYDIGHSWQFLQEMARVMCPVLPALRGIRVVRQWSGLYTVTPDAHPILGDVPGVHGYYQSVGFSGHGFMLAPITGRLMAQLILGQETSLDISGLNLDRFKRGELMVEPSVV